MEEHVVVVEEVVDTVVVDLVVLDVVIELLLWVVPVVDMVAEVVYFRQLSKNMC